MRSLVLLGLLSLVAESYAQAAAYAQCGGLTWAGATACITGWSCVSSNAYYSQCLEVTTTASTSVISATVTSSTAAGTTCPGSFTSLSARAAFAALNPGWNLGNTLDATPNEGSWNNAPVQPSTFTAIQARGFKSIRIPVTWAYHFTTSSPSWSVNSTWMDRVEAVVDQALATGVYVILNAHHDSWIWADPTASGANITQINEKFSSLWAQVGIRFACKSSKLIFEPLNEPVGSDQSAATVLNNLNNIFLTQINNAGGFNPKRVVSLSGLGMDSIKTSEWFVRGTSYPNQPWGLQFHYYSPYDFVFDAWGKTIWGSDTDKASLLNDFQLFNGNFTGIPAFVGEWGASPSNTETAARWKYFDYFIRTAKSFGYSTILWDNGADDYNRVTNTWVDPNAIDILFKATAGISNSLANSTTDPSATSQNSGAYLFHKVGDPVISQSVTYLVNGNTITSIKDSTTGAALTSSQYSVSSGVVTFSSSYLGSLYTPSATAGVKSNLTVTFSAGAALKLQIVQYDTPTFPTTSYTVETSADLYIPVTYKGIPRVAAVKALLADGTYLADTWTVYLGPLQQARWTYGSWSWDSGNFIVYASGLTVIKAAAQTVTLTVEFFPRSVGANAVNITFTQ